MCTERKFSILGPASEYLPSFSHNFSFSALIALSGSPSKRRFDAICLAWMAFSLVAETIQYDPLSIVITSIVTENFGADSFLARLAYGFTKGTFDSNDIVAILIGAIAARFALKLAKNY
jgi:hypothetical protein